MIRVRLWNIARVRGLNVRVRSSISFSAVFNDIPRPPMGGFVSHSNGSSVHVTSRIGRSTYICMGVGCDVVSGRRTKCVFTFQRRPSALELEARESLPMIRSKERGSAYLHLVRQTVTVRIVVSEIQATFESKEG